MAEDVIEIGSFATEAEAALVRGVLDVEGIPARLGETATAGWLWHLGPAMRGVQVLVKQKDAKQAWEIIAPSIAPTDVGRELLSDVQRAWRASIIGLYLSAVGMGVISIIINFYSMCLLVRHIANLNEEDRELDWQGFAALIVNLVAFIVAALLFRYIIF